MIKSTLNTGLRFILSLSLIFMPTYSYSNSVETLVSHLEEEYRRTQGDLPEEFREASRILREMGEAYTENRLGEYIDSRPELKSKFDLLSLSNQYMEALDYAEKPTFVIRFDDENSARSYTRILTNIDVEFNSEGKLVFKGVVVSEDKENKLKKRIGLIHTFEDIEERDVLNWDYDKELLVILHKKRGFILYHMMFARALLGSTPIPSITLPMGNLQNLQNVEMEFIDRTVAPPVGAAHNDVAFNLDGKPMFSAGDLLVSYKNSENEKTITHVLSRSKDFIPALFQMYMILGYLIEKSDFKSSDPSRSSYLERYLTEMMRSSLSAMLNKNAISFFKKFSDLIDLMPWFLLDKYMGKKSESFFTYSVALGTIKR